MPYEPEYRRWESLKDNLVGDNGGRGVIDLGNPVPNNTGFGWNIPDTGIGQ